MCDALSIAGIALTVGSTVANYTASQQVEAARNDALAAERIRQNTLNQEADALNLQSQDRYRDVETQRATVAQEIGDYVAGQSVEPQTPQDILPSSSSNVTVQEEERQRAKARQFTDQAGAALGELRSFGDLLGGIGRDQARDASQIGQIGGFKAGSSNVLPFELDTASKAGDGLKLFGDVLGGAGSIATGAGLSGQGLFGFGGMTPAAATTTAAAANIPFPRPRPQGLVLGSIYGS